MTQEFEQWRLDATTRTEQKTSIFTPQEKEKLKLDYPEKLLAVVPQHLVTTEDEEEFKIHVDAIIAALPETTDIFKANLNTYTALITESRERYSARYKLVKKGAIASQWLAICLVLGTGFGIIFKKVGLGIPFGLLAGIIIGQQKEKKAAEEGRVL